MSRLSFEERLLAAACVYFVVLRLGFSFGAAPLPDEAYYWLWGRHSALSYFDHPPLQGWVQGVSQALFGTSLFALRLPALLALAGTLWFYVRIVGMVTAEVRLASLRAALIYLASPLFGFFTAVVFTDYLLVFLIVAAGYYVLRFLAAFERSGRVDRPALIAAAVLIGLAGLTKYTGAFVGLAVVATILVRPSLRPLLRRWEVYAAGLLAVAMQAPWIIWNLQRGLASLNFHLGGRFEAASVNPGIGAMKFFGVEAVLHLSPFLVPAMVAFVLSRQADPLERSGKVLAFAMLAISTATFLVVANFGTVMWWWNIAAYPLMLPLLWRYVGKVHLLLHAAYGIIANTVLIVSFTVVPLTMALGLPPYHGTEYVFGWDAVRGAVQEEKAVRPQAFIAASQYLAASQLGFALDDPDVVELADRRTAFDDWTDYVTLTGRDAIVVAGAGEASEAWRTRFESIELLRHVEVRRLGVDIYRYDIYLARSFKGM